MTSLESLVETSIEKPAVTYLIRLPEVLRRIPVSRSEWYRRVAAGEAPRPVALGCRARAWRGTDIDAYIGRLGQPNGHEVPSG